MFSDLALEQINKMRYEDFLDRLTLKMDEPAIKKSPPPRAKSCESEASV